MTEKKYVSGEEYQAMSRNVAPQGHQVSIPMRAVGAVIVLIILCGLSFIGGESYGKDHAPKAATTASSFGRSGSSSGGFGGGGFRHSGGFGQVSAVSASSITVQNPRSGTSTTYSITSSTTITDNGQAVAASDIQVGDTVVIQVASSGSTTATTILVNPSFGGGGGGSSSSTGE